MGVLSAQVAELVQRGREHHAYGVEYAFNRLVAHPPAKRRSQVFDLVQVRLEVVGDDPRGGR